MPALVYNIRPAQWVACKAIGLLTPAVYWSSQSGLHFQEVPVPPLPGPRWVRLRTILGGICGTDLSSIMQKHHPASILQVFSSLPAVLGHENVALVDEIGPDVQNWQPGERVVAESSLSCAVREIDPPCPQCAAGRFTLCDNFNRGPLPPGSMIGWNSFTGGSWAPYFVAHESQLYRVPDDLSDEKALLTDPLAGALHAVLKRPPQSGENVLVLGAGFLGLGVAACSRAIGRQNRLVALCRHEQQARWMRHFGANETILVNRSASQAQRYQQVAQNVGGTVLPSRFGHQALVGGFDLVYDCVGTSQSLTDAMKYARSGGTVVEVGTSQIGTVDSTPLWFNELQLTGANGRAFENYNGRRLHTYQIVFELMQQGKLDVTDLLTHRFPVTQYRQAFAALANRRQSGAIKVAFSHPKSD